MISHNQLPVTVGPPILRTATGFGELRVYTPWVSKVIYCSYPQWNDCGLW